MKGAIAAGSEAAVDAGFYALANGGNAVDALISAQLAATISEPVLTGLCGSGIAMINNGTDCISVDSFSHNECFEPGSWSESSPVDSYPQRGAALRYGVRSSGCLGSVILPPP